jgi:glycosyltransferase involved in cell wall biosynthesis
VRFSIIVPVYNREQYVRQAIESVFSQTFTDYELIVIDDGSSNGTPDALRSYGSRIKIIRQNNKGPAAARASGGSRAEGEYLAFLDSDDLFMPNALETYERIIEALHNPSVILGSMTYFHEVNSVHTNCRGPGGVIELVKYKDFLARTGSLGMSFSKIVIRSSVFREVTGLGSKMPAVFPMEDHDLLLRAGTHGPCIVVKKPTTVAYRVHAANYVWNIEAMVKGTMSLIRAERLGEYPGGPSRWLSRCAYIGGKVRFWIWKALRSHHPALAFRLLRSGWMMVAAAGLRTFWGKVRGTYPSYFLHS